MISNSWPGFAIQKQFAVDQAKHDWVFSLDADERVSPQLTESVKKLRTQNSISTCRWLPGARRTYYQGRWIRGGGWYPDRQLRLFRKDAGHWKKRHIHESVEMNPGSQIETLRAIFFITQFVTLLIITK